MKNVQGTHLGLFVTLATCPYRNHGFIPFLNVVRFSFMSLHMFPFSFYDIILYLYNKV